MNFLKIINRGEKNICLTDEEINYVLSALEHSYGGNKILKIRAKRIERELNKALEFESTIFE